MKLSVLNEAMNEATRFLKLAKELRNEMSAKYDGKKYDYHYGGTKNFSAVRRASMDLTRTLANLRKSDY